MPSCARKSGRPPPCLLAPSKLQSSPNKHSCASRSTLRTRCASHARRPPARRLITPPPPRRPRHLAFTTNKPLPVHPPAPAGGLDGRPQRAHGALPVHPHQPAEHSVPPNPQRCCSLHRQPSAAFPIQTRGSGKQPIAVPFVRAFLWAVVHSRLCLAQHLIKGFQFLVRPNSSA